MAHGESLICIPSWAFGEGGGNWVGASDPSLVRLTRPAPYRVKGRTVRLSGFQDPLPPSVLMRSRTHWCALGCQNGRFESSSYGLMRLGLPPCVHTMSAHR